MKSPLARIKRWRWERRFLGTRTLASGLHVPVNSAADLIIYNEVFQDGCYDTAIAETLVEWTAGRPLQLLDLGANVGYFLFRFADLALQAPQSRPEWQAVAVEGNPNTFHELRSRLSVSPGLSQRTKICLGLVGARSGWGSINLDEFHFAAKLQGSGSVPNSVCVPFVDVDSLFAADAPIDLLKCDVEGAEGDFVTSYPELLARTRRVCIELHTPALRDLCVEKLDELGFSEQALLREDTDASGARWLYLFRRRSL